MHVTKDLGIIEPLNPRLDITIMGNIVIFSHGFSNVARKESILIQVLENIAIILLSWNIPFSFGKDEAIF